ncbi:MAG: periplasmic heavy metal sensor, partial [Nitrospirota bacterium]
MKKLPTFLAIIAGIFLIAACASIVSIEIYTNHAEKHAGHNWIHKQLQLTAEQDKALEPIERRYHERCDKLEEQMQLGNKELAQAILASGKDSPRVKDAIGKIHMAMGELQYVTIDHVFEMHSV